MHEATERLAANATLVAEAASVVNSAQTESQQLDTCQADAGNTVCADKDQPALAPQAWEQEEEEPAPGLKLQQCQLLNASVCVPTVQMSKQGKGFMVAVYNALAWERASEPIRVPLDVTASSAATWVVTGQWQSAEQQRFDTNDGAIMLLLVMLAVITAIYDCSKCLDKPD